VVYSSGKGHGTMHEFKIGQYVYSFPAIVLRRKAGTL
jgi:hypothetical protein